MKRAFVFPILLLAIAACQSPQPTAVPTATVGALPPTPIEVPATPVPTSALTAAPTQATTAAPTATLANPPTAAPATPAPATSDAYVNAEGGLNLRAEASATATLLGLLPFATHLTAVGQPTAPDVAGIVWQNVRTDDGQTGWVAAQYLSATPPQVAGVTPPPSPAAPSFAGGAYVYIASVGGLNLREAASASSRIVTMLANGQRLQTNGLQVGPDTLGITWLNVQTDDGVQGWVSAAFVSAQVPSVAPAAPPANVSDSAAEILRRTNDLRAQNGLPPYVLNDTLSQLALAHSQYMAQNGITHIDGSGLSAKQRIANAGFSFGTENIYGGQASIDDAWEYWSTDPPHRDNLLNRFSTLVGIGVYQIGSLTYYTMDFAK